MVADSLVEAGNAARAVKVEYGDLPTEPVLSIDDAVLQNSFFDLDHVVTRGNDIEAALSASEHVAAGRVRLGGQVRARARALPSRTAVGALLL